ncbi:serine/threonine-protein kinase [Streptomyces sp. NPDC035033]|uniref:serine/threonine-protein kinase n=1 Tax=Streptomyces sp. NPDC035033 TaxID=3155368 RepID=UPI0033E54264
MRRIESGLRLGARYELVQPLDSGSMGQVWRGLDLRLKRPVAVKLALPGLPGHGFTPEQVSRFEREAEAAAGLDAVNITTVYDAGTDVGDGSGSPLHWLVMQLVDGATLADLLAEQDGGRFDLPTATAVAAQVCTALAALHSRGFVHRDLKPENVMVRRDGVVKVLDFGLVKVLSEAGPRLTATGECLGNLWFASPEMLLGSRDLDGRSDLYAVGCLLHTMLAGAPPFPSKVPMAVFEGHTELPPPPLAPLDVTVPQEVQELVSGLLAKDREKRPASAAEVYRLLMPWLPRPVPGRGEGWFDEAEDPRRPYALPQAPFPL